MKKHSNKKAIAFAFLWMIVGSILLLNNLNLLPQHIPSYILSWKMLLVVLGVLALFKKNWFMGFLLIGVGKYFLLPEMYGVPQPDVYTIWPVLLIFLGLMILLHQLFPSNKHRKFRLKTEVTETSNHMEHTLIFGGESKKVNSFDFSGGKITSIFAGSEIDLTNCCLSKGVNEIEITAVLGGVSLTVPKEWNVITKIVPIMGGVFDEINMMPDAYVDPAAELTIKGVAVMGGIEIKRA